MYPTMGSSGCLLSLLMVAAGTLHFVVADFYLRLMPPYLPCQPALVYLGGICEIVLGLLLLLPHTSRWAAWGIIALLSAVFPANIHVYLQQDIIPAPPILHLLRLQLQTVFIF